MSTYIEYPVNKNTTILIEAPENEGGDVVGAAVKLCGDRLI